MNTIRPVGITLAVALSAAAYSFTINETYGFGHETHYADSYGAIDLNGISKVSGDDPILSAFAQLLAYPYDRPNDVVAAGEEIPGEWIVDEYSASAIAGGEHSEGSMSYGSTFRSRILSDVDLTDMRFVFLSNNSDGIGVHVKTLDDHWGIGNFWYFRDDWEAVNHNGIDLAGPYDYREIASDGHYTVPGIGGYAGQFEGDRWLLLFDEQTDLNGDSVLWFRGGLHFGESTTIYSSPVPEPATLSCVLLGLAGVVLRRRRTR